MYICIIYEAFICFFKKYIAIKLNIRCIIVVETTFVIVKSLKLIMLSVEKIIILGYYLYKYLNSKINLVYTI